jgi:hypothetical protein
MLVRLGIVIAVFALLLILGLSTLVGVHKAVPVSGMPVVRQFSQMTQNSPLLPVAQTAGGQQRVGWVCGPVRCWRQPGPPSPDPGWGWQAWGWPRWDWGRPRWSWGWHHWGWRGWGWHKTLVNY